MSIYSMEGEPLSLAITHESSPAATAGFRTTAAFALSLALCAALTLGLLVAAPAARAQAGLSDREAARFAKREANRYTERRFDIDGLDAWRARCHDIRPEREFGTFSCRVTFNRGQCTGRLRLDERTLRGYRFRIGCGD